MTLLVSGPVRLEQLPRVASLLEARREQGEAVWIAAGPLFSDTLVALMTDGFGPIRALEHSGAHAAILGPELLNSGAEAARRLIARSKLHLLCANISDSLGEPVGHPILIHRGGNIRLGLSAVRIDTSDALLRVAGIAVTPADRAAGRALGLLRMHSDLAGLALDAGADARFVATGYDFTIGGDGAAAIPEQDDIVTGVFLSVEAGRVTEHRAVKERLANWPEDPGVRRFMDSLRAGVDSALAEHVVEATVVARPEALTRMFVTGRLGRDIDAFLTDRPLFKASLGPGAVDTRSVIQALEEPGPLAVVALTGWQIKELTEQAGITVEWRTAMRHMRLAMSRQYRVAMTPGFIRRHLQDIRDWEPDDEPAWRVAARLLARER